MSLSFLSQRSLLGFLFGSRGAASRFGLSERSTGEAIADSRLENRRDDRRPKQELELT
jgi:hypothetical protein